jgi:hypothetical protein
MLSACCYLEVAGVGYPFGSMLLFRSRVKYNNKNKKTKNRLRQ